MTIVKLLFLYYKSVKININFFAHLYVRIPGRNSALHYYRNDYE